MLKKPGTFGHLQLKKIYKKVSFQVIHIYSNPKKIEFGKIQ